nr:alpha/beta fold hydrolase [Leucobacter weissii]
MHGVGVGPESWDGQIAALPRGFEGIAPAVTGMTDTDAASFSLEAAAREVWENLELRGVAKAHLCGLSLGAMVATRFAIDYPERTASLTLSGAQARPPRILLGIQTAVLRVLPARLATPPGMSKRGLRAVLRAVGAVDLRAELPLITAPTLVMCGSRDHPNLPAARELAAAIPDAKLQIVPGARHEWNTQMPEVFSARLNQFLFRVGG